MIKLQVTYTKKVPGPEQYSSQGYHVGIETEVSDDAVKDPQGMRERLASMFQEARRSIEEEIANDRSTQPHQEVHPRFPSNGNNDRPVVRDNGELISPKQMNFLLSLSSRQHGMTVEQLNAYAGQEVGIDNVRELTKKQASALIECLKS